MTVGAGAKVLGDITLGAWSRRRERRGDEGRPAELARRRHPRDIRPRIARHRDAARGVHDWHV